MSQKGEIGWQRRNEEGMRIEVYAHKVGKRWDFFSRPRKRNIPWQRLERPLLEDWQALLDGVKRRVARRIHPPEEVSRIRQQIAERFPEEELHDE